MEITAKGYHYWFVRPDLCTHFDGAAQVVPNVDFKTVCMSGTSGIVVAAPSKGKRWVRELTAESLVDIPAEVLDAVAVKRQSPVTVRLSFICGAGEMYTENKWISEMTYFYAVDESVTFPVPCNKSIFDEILFVLDHNELNCFEPSRELFKNMLDVADMLGMKQYIWRRLERSLTTGIPRGQLDIYETNKYWWRALLTEKRWMRTGKPLAPLEYSFEDTVKFKYIDTARFNQVTTSINLPRDERFLFHECAASKPKTIASFKLDLMIAVAPSVRSILEMYPGKIVLAGGMAASALCRDMGPGHDNDLYFVGVDEVEANVMLHKIVGGSPFLLTHNAVTLQHNNDILQFVLRLHESPTQLITGFDIAPCKACIFHNGKKLVACVAPTFIESARCGAFPIDFTNWGGASPVRVMKYINKGFDAFVPCLRRKPMRLSNSMRPGVASLLGCERLMKYSKPIDIVECIKYTKFESDYTTGMYIHGRLIYIFRALMALFSSRPVLPRHVKMHPRTMGPLHAVPPMFGRCFVMEDLAAALKK
jgi:hypothetical protein